VTLTEESEILIQNAKLLALCGKLERQLADLGVELDSNSRKLANEITSRRHSDESLRESERKFHEISRNLPGVIFELRVSSDGSNHFTYISKRSEEIFGIPARPTDPDWDFLTYVHPSDRQRLMTSLVEGFSGHEEWRFEGRLVNPSGEVKWFQGISSSTRVGEELVFDGLMLDITKRKMAENDLEIMLTKYKVLFESNPLGITITDKEGNILEANREAERLLGLPAKNHVGRSIDSSEWKIIAADGAPFPSEEYASVIALRENRVVENVVMGIVKPGGDVTWINVTAAPIPIENYGVAITYGEIKPGVTFRAPAHQR
jgi:PAS domain S-box-containing protein